MRFSNANPIDIDSRRSVDAESEGIRVPTADDDDNHPAVPVRVNSP
jgi:hypothetical protein